MVHTNHYHTLRSIVRGFCPKWLTINAFSLRKNILKSSLSATVQKFSCFFKWDISNVQKGANKPAHHSSHLKRQKYWYISFIPNGHKKGRLTSWPSKEGVMHDHHWNERIRTHTWKMPVAVWRTEKKSLRDRVKSCLLSQLHRSNQKLHEVDAKSNAGSSVSDNCKSWVLSIPTSERCGERGFR